MHLFMYNKEFGIGFTLMLPRPKRQTISYLLSYGIFCCCFLLRSKTDLSFFLRSFLNQIGLNMYSAFEMLAIELKLTNLTIKQI